MQQQLKIFLPGQSGHLTRLGVVRQHRKADRERQIGQSLGHGHALAQIVDDDDEPWGPHGRDLGLRLGNQGQGQKDVMGRLAKDGNLKIARGAVHSLQAKIRPELIQVFLELGQEGKKLRAPD